jgi:hypothetical protein
MSELRAGNLMRYTVVEARGTVSFVTRCELLPYVVSACATGPNSLTELFTALGKWGEQLRDYVESGLAVFDEHNSIENPAAIHGAIRHLPPAELPVFRVLDDITRQASLQPVKAGVIIFNLGGRRIVQIQNAYVEIRKMTGRVQRLEKAGWRIVP